MKIYWDKEDSNWGASLLPLLLERYDIDTSWCPLEEAEAIGSSTPLSKLNGLAYKGHILGSGLQNEAERPNLSEATVHSLRGRRTLYRCTLRKDQKPLLGDLGILAEDLLLDKPSKQTFSVGIIPGKDKNHPQLEKFRLNDSFCIIEEKPGIEFIKDIAHCQYIVSTVLYGIIISDSLGIPSCRVKLNSLEEEFAFRDYYSLYDAPFFDIWDINLAVRKTRVRNVVYVKNRMKCVFEDFVDKFILSGRNY